MQMSEKMTQEEIDRYMESINSGIPDPPPVNAKTINIEMKYRTLLSMIARLNYAWNNMPPDGLAEAKRQVHHAAFNLWLANRDMTQNEYYWLMNRELKKRGYPPFFKV